MLRFLFLSSLFILSHTANAQERADQIIAGYQLLADQKYEASLDLFMLLIDEDSKDSEGWIGCGTVYYETKKPNATLDYMGKALELGADDPRPYYYIGQVHYSHRKYADALSSFDAVYALDSLYSDINFLLGSSLVETGDSLQADLYLTRQIELSSGHAFSSYYLGKWHMYQGDFTTAADHIQMAIDQNPSVPRFWLAQGDICFASGELDDAATAYSGAVSRNPDYSEARYRRGLTFLLQEKFLLAELDLEAAIAQKPKDKAIRTSLADATYSAGHFDKAASHFEHLMAQEPNNMELLYRRALSYFHGKKYMLALDDFSILADAYPTDPAIQFQMGNCYERLEDLPNALKYYEMCLISDPDQVRAKFNRASVLYGLDRKSEACAVWQELRGLEIMQETVENTLRDYCE
ncbi:MAG: tetratricopeptide (TPR) repeat protein [Flavobacteriales bacterium]|jgi:tetratricopeptide (TPR) repeat protein